MAPLFNLEFYVSYVRRVLIFALAATGLNLVLGYGGMVALGHAAFLVPAPMRWSYWRALGFSRPWWCGLSAVWPRCWLSGGAVSLRTRGVYFIMITLAFAQMVYYIFISLRQYGVKTASTCTAVPGCRAGLVRRCHFYYVVLAVLWC